MAYRFKNTTVSTLTHAASGIALLPSIYYDASVFDVSKLYDSELTGWITAGSVIFNDGTSDYTAANGLAYLNWPGGISAQVKFNNSTNGFVATNDQAAIEEAKNTATGRARFLGCCGFDGNASSGRYLEYNSNVDSNISGFVIPRAAKLKELSLVHTANSAVTFQILSWNGTTETLLTSINTTASERKKSVTGLDIALTANIELRVKCSAGSCARPIVFQWYIFD